MTDECGCIPQGTEAEKKRMDLWLSGKEVAGFPKHETTAFKGYHSDRPQAILNAKDLATYRAKNKVNQEDWD